MVAKKGKHESVERVGENGTPSFSVSVPESYRQGPLSSLNGAAASAIGMGLVLQSGRAEARTTESGEAVVPDEAVRTEERQNIMVEDTETAPEAPDLQVMAQASSGEIVEEPEFGTAGRGCRASAVRTCRRFGPHVRDRGCRRGS